MASKEIYVERKGNIHSTIRKIGRDVSNEKSEKIETFIALKKNLMIFKDETYIIKFDNFVYQTDNQQDIKFLKSHPLFNKEFWKDNYPDYVIQKMKEDQKYIMNREEAEILTM